MAGRSRTLVKTLRNGLDSMNDDDSVLLLHTLRLRVIPSRRTHLPVVPMHSLLDVGESRYEPVFLGRRTPTTVGRSLCIFIIDTCREPSDVNGKKEVCRLRVWYPRQIGIYFLFLYYLPYHTISTS